MNSNQLLSDYRSMLLIRRFEEALADLFTNGLVGGTSHFCIGQEACAVGVLGESDPRDPVISHHRGHGHLLARGLEPVRIMAELLGKSTGYCKGRGGSQHMCSLEHAFIGTNGITGGGIPVATGVGLAVQKQQQKQVAICFFGDGATNQGTFHESLNMAALLKLPVLYVCENNHYAMSQPIAESMSADSVVKRAQAANLRAEGTCGMDVNKVRELSAKLLQHVREGNGPALLELSTYRFCGHSKNDRCVYRTREEEADWKENDCLVISCKQLTDAGLTEQVSEIDGEIETEVAAIVEEARNMPFGDRNDAIGAVYAE